MLEEAFESPGFWILGGGGVAMEVIGFLVSKKAGFGSFPLWELIVIMVGTLIAAAFFATRE